MNIDTDKRELIDRWDAIEAVSDYIFFDVYGGMKPVEKCKAEAKSILCDIEPEPHWISCSERLPNHDEYIKNNGLFIVSDGNRSYSEWYDIYNKRKFGEPTISGFRIDYAVTAWMSLPEPYNGGVRCDER